MIHNITFCLLRMGNNAQQCWLKMLQLLAFQERQIYLSHKQFYSMSNFTDPLLRLGRKLRMGQYEMPRIFGLRKHQYFGLTLLTLHSLFYLKAYRMSSVA